MLGVVDNQLVRLEPVLEYQGGFSLDVTFNPYTQQGALHAMCALGRLDCGVRYYVMSEDPGLDVTLNKVTGEFSVRTGYGLVKFRVVAGNQAFECELAVERKEVA